MRIIVITPDWEVPDEIEKVIALFDNGLKILHLRKPGYSKEALKNYLRKIPEKYRSRIVIHSLENRDLVKSFRLKGLHINSDERTGPMADFLRVSFLKLLYPDMDLTTTFRTRRNLKKAGNFYDYLILNNIFKSRSEKSYKQYHDWTKLEDFLSDQSGKILARGGVTKEKLNEVSNIGFRGATVMDYIWSQDDPVKAFIELNERAEEIKARAKQRLY